MKNDKEIVQRQSTDAAVRQQADQKQAFRHTLDRVRQAANAGNAKAQHAVHACLVNSPNLCQEFGNAAVHAQMTLVELISSGEVLTSAAITRQAESMKQELAGPSPSAPQEMVAQRVVTTWLHLAHTETQFLQAQQDLGWARYWLKRLEVADKLHRTAIASLMLIRNLLSAAAPASLPAIVDAAPQPPASKTCDVIEVPVPDQFPVPQPVPVRSEPVNGCRSSANRIANYVPCPVDAPWYGMDYPVVEKPKTNGYHHRLESMLVNGHSKQGGSK